MRLRPERAGSSLRSEKAGSSTRPRSPLRVARVIGIAMAAFAAWASAPAPAKAGSLGTTRFAVLGSDARAPRVVRSDPGLREHLLHRPLRSNARGERPTGRSRSPFDHTQPRLPERRGVARRVPPTPSPSHRSIWARSPPPSPGETSCRRCFRPSRRRAASPAGLRATRVGPPRRGSFRPRRNAFRFPWNFETFRRPEATQLRGVRFIKIWKRASERPPGGQGSPGGMK